MRLSGVLAAQDLATRLNAVSIESLTYFEPYTENNLPLRLAHILRTGNLALLKQGFHESQLRLHSQFGESLIQLVCHWRSIPNALAIVHWLVDEVRLPLNVRDRHGRSPLHTACMAAAESSQGVETSQQEVQFPFIRLLLERAPELLLFEDNHGKVPLEFVPFQDHEAWNSFFESIDIEGLASSIRQSVQAKSIQANKEKVATSDDMAAALAATFSPNERAAQIVSHVQGILF